MPALGFGVFLAQGNEAQTAVEIALANGYRLIDTAAIYGNEEQVGQAIKNSGANREELFITTKLWIADYGYEEALKAFEKSLQKLQLEYIDLYLLHWPTPSVFDKTIESWKALENLYASGKVKAIGVCNFTEEHLKELKKHSKIESVLNQVELHPYFSQQELNGINTENRIVTQAWSPIGGAMIYHPEERALPHILEHPTVMSIAEKYHKTSAQVVLRWHLQKGCSAIPKSVQEHRIIENFNVFDFELSEEDMRSIDNLNQNLRVGPHPDQYDLNYKA